MCCATHRCVSRHSHAHLKCFVITSLTSDPAPLTVLYDGPVCDSRYCPSLPLLLPDPNLILPSLQTETDQPSLVWFDRGKFYLTFEGKLRFMYEDVARVRSSLIWLPPFSHAFTSSSYAFLHNICFALYIWFGTQLLSLAAFLFFKGHRIFHLHLDLVVWWFICFDLHLVFSCGS